MHRFHGNPDWWFDEFVDMMFGALVLSLAVGLIAYFWGL